MSLPPVPKNWHWAKGVPAGGLHAWLGQLRGLITGLESRSGTSVFSGMVPAFEDLPDAVGRDGQAWVVLYDDAVPPNPHPRMYVSNGSPTWGGPVSVEGSATAAAVAAALGDADVALALDAPVAGRVAAVGSTTRTAVNAAIDARTGNGQRPVGRGELMLNVKDYGAAGDGTTNDITAIGNTASATPTTGATIFLPPGRFFISTRISNLKQGTTLRGAGPGATTLVLSSTALQASASDVLIADMTIEGPSGQNQLFNPLALATAQNRKNWRFENVKFVGIWGVITRLGSAAHNGVVHTSGSDIASYLEFDHCEFTGGARDALDIRGTHYATVDRCHFHDIGTNIDIGEMLKIESGARDWKVLHSTFERGTRDAIDTYDAYGGLIDGCSIDSTGGQGIEMKAADTTHNPTDRNILRALQIRRTGLVATNSPAIQVANDRTTVTECVVEETAGPAYRVGKAVGRTANVVHNILMGNRAIGAGADGYLVNGSDNTTLIGNSAEGCTGRGFNVPTSLNSSVIGGAALNQSTGNGTADQWT